MRRLWSYIILAGTSLVLMGSTFANVFKNSTSNIEYSDGRELVFRISEKDESELIEKTDSGETPAQIVSKTMIERLDSMKVTNYEVATESYDTVKVTLKQETDENYGNIQTLMTFDGSLALSSKKNDFRVNSDESEKFITGKAYMETKNNYPTVNIPVGDHFKEIYDIVKQYKEDDDTSAAESQTTGEGEEAETTYTYNLYLWHDYEDGNTYEQTQSGNEDYDPRVANKIFMRFDVGELTTLEDEGKEIDKLTAYVNIQDANNDSKYEASDVRKAFATANYFVALINSGALDYKVTFLYSHSVSAMSEALLTTEGNLQWSFTLRATLVCIVIIALLLAVFYRLGALAVATLTLGSVYAGVASIILFTAEFNAAGVIALCAVAIASLACGVIQLTKLKEEAYRGRSLKKANSESTKKALLPIVDINVVLIIMGIFAYIFGGALMRTFAIISVIGGLASLILNVLGLRGMMWLATNTTKLQGKYEVFGIDSKNVPNVLNEEKQTFYGSYANKDFTAKKKPVAIISGLLLVTGIAGMIVFGTLNKGVVYNNGGTTLNSEIFIETNNKNTVVTEAMVREVLSHTYTYEKDESKAKALSDNISDILYETREDYGEDKDDTITYTYYTIKLNNKLDNSKVQGYYVELDEEGKEISRTYSTDYENGVSELLTETLKLEDPDITADIKVGNLVSTQQPEFAPVFWGTIVGIAVSAFYLLLRYRLTRGLVSFIVPAGITTAVAGFFAYTRLAVTNYAVVTLPLVAVFALFVAIIFMNKERELVLEDKSRDNSIENRKAIMVRATSLSYSPILLASFLAIYIGINFFGFGPARSAWLYLIFVVGVLVTIFVSTTLFGPLSHLFFRLFSKVNLDKLTSKFKRKKRKKVVSTPRSAEPEERTFIGIND